MIRVEVLCPQCRVPFTHTIASDKPSNLYGWSLFVTANVATTTVSIRIYSRLEVRSASEQ